jgi:DNA (cytosine-5)-methyltransferase 1
MIHDHVAGGLSELDQAVVRAVPPGGNWRNLPADFASKRVDQIRESAARGEGSRSTYYGRLRWDRPSYTISTYFNRPGNGCFIHPSAPRLITVREAARLQSFPDSFRFYGEGRSRFVQVGNAVPPLMAYQLAQVLPRGQVVDVFAGVGGLSLGFEWAGFPVIAAADNDQAASRAYQLNRQQDDVSILADLGDSHEHSVAMKEIERRAGREGVLLVAGGPPCQGFSTAGDCRLDDLRNHLVFGFVAAVERLKPAMALMENVPQLAYRRGRAILTEIRRALHALGYETSVIIAHTEAYGVPQLRRRLFLLAGRGMPLTWPRPWLQVMAPAHPDQQPGAQHVRRAGGPVTVEQAIADLPGQTASSADSALAYEVPSASAYQRWARGELSVAELLPEVVAVDEEPVLFTTAASP